LRVLRRGCLYLAYREIGPEEVGRGLAEPCPADELTASVLYSADLGLRWLPDLIGLARGVGEGDPLVEGLRQLGAAWPLSSVGVVGVVPSELPEALGSDPCLRTLYVDRILASEDTSRLTDQRVADRAAAALGLYPELCPAVAEALETADS
jgi:hypothetical protein